MVWTVSDGISQEIRSLGGESVRSDNGVDWSAFARAGGLEPAPDIISIPQPRIGLVGRLNDRIDWHLVENICRRRPAWNLIFVGPIYGDENQCRDTRRILLGESRPPNLYHLPGVPPEEIPNKLAGLDVGLIPYQPVGANLSINPLKLYQFLATGLAVVAAPLPSLRVFDGYLRLASTPADFCAAIEAALSEPTSRDVLELRRERVREYDWENVAMKRIESLQAALDCRG